MSLQNKNTTYFAAISLVISMIVGVSFLSNIYQPPIDQHSFRQCQTGITAFWFDWKCPLSSFLKYETPIFGVPWKVPFEFPLYQAIVSAVSQLSGLSIHAAGRLTSIAFFLLTLLPFASLAKGLGLGGRFFFITAIFWVCSPLYLYWSRSVMIESTAVFFGFVFLAAVDRMLTNWNWHWCLTAFVASLACALVKVTTYPTFGLAAVGIVVWKLFPANIYELKKRETLRRVLLPLVVLGFLGFATTATVMLWTENADSIKLQNEIAQVLTSKNLCTWNFGTTAQKMNPDNWLKIFYRSIPEAIGSTWALGFLLVAGCFLQGKRAALLVGLLGLFILPFALFTNLHLVHNYYQYANSFWLVLALGLSVSEISEKVPFFLAGLVVLTILMAQILTYSVCYFPFLRTQTTGALEAAKFLQANSKEQECILVVGDGWSPEIAYLSGRRAVYILDFASSAVVEGVFKKLSTNPESVFGANPVSYLVLNESNLKKYYSPALQETIKKALVEIGIDNSKGIPIGGYELLKINAEKRGMRIQGAQTKKPQIDQCQTQVLFDSLARTTLGNTFKIENRSTGIFLHPGCQPTEAVFDIAGKFHGVQLVGFITELPLNGLEDPLAGTTGVELFLDGKSLGRRTVDRFTNQNFSLDLTNAKELKVLVDCANGSTAWDHFYLGVAK